MGAFAQVQLRRGTWDELVPGTWVPVRSSRRIEAVAAVPGDTWQYRYRCTPYRYPVRQTRRARAGSRHGSKSPAWTSYRVTVPGTSVRVLSRIRAYSHESRWS